LGDVLYTAVGSYGTAVSVDTDRRFAFQRHIAHIKPLSPILSAYLAAALNSPMVMDRAHEVARGVAQKTVTLGELRRFPIPVCHENEQLKVIEAVEVMSERVTAVREGCGSSLRLLGDLNGSILAKAFRGELVPQDPSDEPASVLLDRIRAERATAAAAKEKKPAKRR
jgi:type I restriction enzyme S subunit